MVVLAHHHLQQGRRSSPEHSSQCLHQQYHNLTLASHTSPPLNEDSWPPSSPPSRRTSPLSSSLPPSHATSNASKALLVHSKGALHIRSGQKDSSVDLLLGSWIHCDLPTGTSLDIATAFAFLDPAADAPHLLVELIQSSPTSLIMLMDLLPRQVLVLHPDCLKAFYEDTHLEKQRQKLVTITETDLFFSSNLYIRGVLSPTAILVTIDCASGQVARSMEEIVRDVVDQVVDDVVRTWSDADHGGGGELVVRDGLIKKKAVEIDLAANLPRLLGEEVAGWWRLFKSRLNVILCLCVHK